MKELLLAYEIVFLIFFSVLFPISSCLLNIQYHFNNKNL